MAVSQGLLSLMEDPKKGFDRASFTKKMQQAESSGGKFMDNPHSNAAGPSQIMENTWKGLVKNNPKSIYARVAWRSKEFYLPENQDAAVFDLQSEHLRALQRKNLPVNEANMYAMWVLGTKDGTRVLTTSGKAPLDSILSKQIMRDNPHFIGLDVDKFVGWSEGKMGVGKDKPLEVSATPPSRPLPVQPKTGSLSEGLQQLFGIVTEEQRRQESDQEKPKKIKQSPLSNIGDTLLNLIGIGTAEAAEPPKRTAPKNTNPEDLKWLSEEMGDKVTPTITLPVASEKPVGFVDKEAEKALLEKRRLEEVKILEERKKKKPKKTYYGD